MDVGIARIVITDQVTGRGGWRFRKSRGRWPIAHRLYQQVFDRLGTPLLFGKKAIKCTLAEFIAGYDYELGIDVILTLADGRELTLQEKFLYTTFKTVTVEYMQNPMAGELGDWFKMRAQLYFVGYDRMSKPHSFQDWILLNWPSVQTEHSINWRENGNMRDGARASFRYAEFNQFPSSCILACSDDRKFGGIDGRDNQQ